LGIPRFERGNVERLRKVLLETISSEERLEELSQQGLSLSRNYSWERTVEETFSFLQKFI
jgi:glycosyltransferase involved in cell wall biosynthesis